MILNSTVLSKGSPLVFCGAGTWKSGNTSRIYIGPGEKCLIVGERSTAMSQIYVSQYFAEQEPTVTKIGDNSFIVDNSANTGDGDIVYAYFSNTGSTAIWAFAFRVEE